MKFKIGDRVRVKNSDIGTGTVINTRTDGWYLTVRLDKPNPVGITKDLWIATAGEVEAVPAHFPGTEFQSESGDWFGTTEANGRGMVVPIEPKAANS